MLGEGSEGVCPPKHSDPVPGVCVWSCFYHVPTCIEYEYTLSLMTGICGGERKEGRQKLCSFKHSGFVERRDF